MATPHYDQLGHVEGWMTLRGERIRIDGIGVRDRTWGPRGGPYAASPKSYASDLDRVKHPGGARWREIERERGRGRIQCLDRKSTRLKSSHSCATRMPSS